MLDRRRSSWTADLEELGRRLNGGGRVCGIPAEVQHHESSESKDPEDKEKELLKITNPLLTVHSVTITTVDSGMCDTLKHHYFNCDHTHSEIKKK